MIGVILFFWIIGVVISTLLRIIGKETQEIIIDKKNYTLCLCIPLYFFIWGGISAIKKAL